ncbi:MAG: pyridoxal phosphate-dependent aminotransferase [Paludibacteraceae bacterium]|nr:pyridoxal phosphate-dependent aminotransferase [Paludibacteraceae bacterium]
MKHSPLDITVVQSVIDSLNISNFSKATIREVVTIASTVEQKTGQKYIRMEMGVPGIAASQIGVEAEIEALEKGVASIYPTLEGIPALKNEASRFIKAFIDIDIKPACCVPAVGSMNGTYASFLVAGQCHREKDTVLFLDPGFPVQKMQLQVLGYKSVSFDVYGYRGEKLHDKMEEFLQKGNISTIIYSNPNNPSWICLNQEELAIIGKLATKYDVIVLEDLAYFAMDFRHDISTPFEAPYQPSVAKYTDNYVLLISGSKAFSYAGQRIGIIAMSPTLYQRSYPHLTERYGVGEFGNVLISRVLYSLSAGVTHSTQYALAAMFKAASDGGFNFLESLKEYGRRATSLKEIFAKHHFYIVYDTDLGEPLADGFYFTVSYPNMTGSNLMRNLLFYGISAISLNTTGSTQEGLRICTSFVNDSQYDDLDYKLSCFNTDFPI